MRLVDANGEAARRAEALGHLLACLDDAANLMEEVGQNVDAQVIRGHRAQLAAGREWPGMVVEPTVFTDGSTSADVA